MVKTKKASTDQVEKRCSARLLKRSSGSAPAETRKVAPKRTPKAKKSKQTENGSTKAEEPSTETTDTK